MPNDRRRDHGEGGFSLLEVLVSLALISVTTLLIYRVVIDQFALSQRIERVNSLTLDTWSHRQVFADSIGAIVPEWSGSEPDNTFYGASDRFGGLTGQSQFEFADRLVPFSFTLQGNQLIYQEAGAWIVLEVLPEEATFSYLGDDHIWHPKWPPDERTDAGAYDDSEFYEQPQLPVAIRLRCQTGACVDWIRALDWQGGSMIRRQDITDF